MEAIRLDEGPVLKTGGGEQPFVSSSLTASALVRLITEVIRTGEEPAWKAGGGRHAACGFEPHGFRLKNMGSWSNRMTPASHAGDPGATPGDST